MNLSEQTKQLILRCQRSPQYFIENFCKVKHPNAGIIPFTLFKYQKTSLQAFTSKRYNIYRKCRQSGISTLAGAFVLWFGMFYPQKTILIVSKRDEDAKAFLDKNVKFVYNHLPQFMKDIFGDPPPTFNEHTVAFSHGTSIKSLTSSPDTLRSNSASINIIDEAAFMPKMDLMWAGGQQTLVHGGSVIVISTCVSPETYVFTSCGMCQMKDLAPSNYPYFDDGYYYSDYNGPQVFGLQGLQNPTKFYKRSIEPTKIIKTTAAYNIEVSTTHKLLIVRNGEIQWINSTDIKINDYAIIFRGQNIFGNNDDIDYVDQKTGFSIKRIEPDLAYMLGIITAEGSLQKCAINIASGDQEILQYFINNRYGWKWKVRRNQKYSIDCNSAAFVRFLLFLGFELVKAPNKQIPKRILSCSREVVRAYLQGLFDGDGFGRSRDGEVGLVSTSFKLLEQVRNLLTNFGIISKQENRPGYNKEFNLNDRHYISKCLPHGRLLIRSGEAIKFYDKIGFRLSRKQQMSLKCKESIEYIPNAVELIKEFKKESGLSIAAMNSFGIQNSVLFGRRNRRCEKLSRQLLMEFIQKALEFKNLLNYQKIVALLNSRYYYDKVVKIDDSKSELMDFTIPVGHNFIGNSFINHQTNGVGNWYHSTWEDAEQGKNDFNPININWWDMDWEIKYRDDLSGEDRVLSPTAGLRKCMTKEDIDKWGPYYSPWLEEQYRQMQEKGEAHKFRQEILAEFLGTGNTVVNREALQHIQTTVTDRYSTVEQVSYIHPVSGDRMKLDFDNKLWIWRKPVKPEPDIIEHGKIIQPGKPGHTYVIGVDISSGEGEDFSAIEVIDIVTKEQVAELNIYVRPGILLLMVDYLGRWYNGAFCVPERTGIGIPFCQALYIEIAYYNIFRMLMPSGKRSKKVGYPTSPVYKPAIVKCLMDMLGEAGITVYSSRLMQQLSIFVHKPGKRTGAVEGPGNHDDLSIAMGLALMGIREAVQSDSSALVPMRHVPTDEGMEEDGQLLLPKQGELTIDAYMALGGMNALMPHMMGPQMTDKLTPQEEVQKFMAQMGGVPIGSKAANPALAQKRYVIEYPHKNAIEPAKNYKIIRR